MPPPSNPTQPKRPHPFEPTQQESPIGPPHADAAPTIAVSPLDSHAEELLTKRAQGGLLGEIQHWLNLTYGIIVKGSELAAFFKKHEDAAQARRIAEARAKLKADLEYEQLMYVHPSAATVPQSTTLNHKPLASELDPLMAVYMQFSVNKILDGDASPQSIGAVDKMVRTLMLHHQDKVRLDQSERALKIREEEHQMKMRKAAAEETAKEEAKRHPAKEFDNSEKIASMRREYFKDVDELCASDTMPYPMPDNFEPPLRPQSQSAAGQSRASVLPADQTQPSSVPQMPKPARVSRSNRSIDL